MIIIYVKFTLYTVEIKSKSFKDLSTTTETLVHESICSTIVQHSVMYMYYRVLSYHSTTHL